MTTQDERTFLAGEWRAAGEFAQLVADPIYYGVGVPRGDGRLVLVLPGLFGNDLYLEPLHIWLRRIGYRPVRSALAINAGCPERLSRQVEIGLHRRMQSRPGRAALIGHSRGGILATAIAARLQEQASHLILLGSPSGALVRTLRRRSALSADAVPARRSVAEASNRARRLLDPDCDFPDCGCPFPADLRRPLSSGTRIVSVYSRDDPIVPPWASSVAGARNVEVTGTHSGLVYNRVVYQEIAAILSVQH